MRFNELTDEQILKAKEIYWDKNLTWDQRMKSLMDFFGKSERTVRTWCSQKLKFKQNNFTTQAEQYIQAQKKVFDKTITNYVHTLRTIGNCGVHEHDRGVSKLKLDAHLMIIALISFLNELNDKKFLS